jgi:hypothetical protein
MTGAGFAVFAFVTVFALLAILIFTKWGDGR